MHVELMKSPSKDIQTLLHVWESQAPRMISSVVSVHHRALRKMLLSVVAGHASISWAQTSSHFSSNVERGASRAWVPTMWDLHRAVNAMQTVKNSASFAEAKVSDFVHWCGYGGLPTAFISKHAVSRTFEFFNLDGEKEPKTFIGRAIATVSMSRVGDRGPSSR